MLDSSIRSRRASTPVLWLRRALVCGLLVPLVCAAVSMADETAVDFPFDLTADHDTLSVLVDLSGLLQTPIIGRIESGIDQAFECRALLNRPRRLFGAVRVAETSSAWRLSYRILTELWVLRQLGEDSLSERSFGSLAALAQFLSDSVAIPLIRIDSLDSGRRYVLRLEITSISLAGINIAPTPESQEESSSILRSLFSEFLKFTGYGRSSHSVESRPFSPAEIDDSR
jgi:hypothetical protein